MTKPTPLQHGPVIPKANPHFRSVERAPYEMGFLLKAIANDVSSFALITDDQALEAEAIARHADNAQEVISRGLEAIGEVLSIAACNAESTVNGSTVSAIGEIIRHLTVEAQLMRDMGGLMTDTVAAHQKRRAQ
ncbi:hypothetical protein [Glaciimonas immobilis]|uniref:Methyl-accepting chemotaxis protein n=1 Tax=Glaciimonas immobilis TaxID=728004 RepID=A0A840RWE5_9BURK|nr:hypothetical protein [Glaciimonas immobilis]KAF3996629.1 hypothetical protein HAV38_18540 [Glaciimonas immobilis]MBB5200994.1 hypothetical protein [Glaciimonas immobilis]